VKFLIPMNEESRMGMSLHSCASPGLYAVDINCEVALAYIIEKNKWSVIGNVSESNRMLYKVNGNAK
jgi:hypothetical protein